MQPRSTVSPTSDEAVLLRMLARADITLERHDAEEDGAKHARYWIMDECGNGTAVPSFVFDAAGNLVSVRSDP
jgi:hypothetical protein